MTRRSLASLRSLSVPSSCPLRSSVTIRFRSAVTSTHRTSLRVICLRIQLNRPIPARSRKDTETHTSHDVSHVNSSERVCHSTTRSSPNAVRTRADPWKGTTNCHARLTLCFFVGNPFELDVTPESVTRSTVTATGGSPSYPGIPSSSLNMLHEVLHGRLCLQTLDCGCSGEVRTQLRELDRARGQYTILEAA